MPLLHLSNIFHRGNLIHEALTPLKTAISLSPHSGVLYYTLGKIYVVSNTIILLMIYEQYFFVMVNNYNAEAER